MDSTVVRPLSMTALTDSGQGRDCNGLVLDSVPGQPLSLQKEEVKWSGQLDRVHKEERREYREQGAQQ